MLANHFSKDKMSSAINIFSTGVMKNNAIAKSSILFFPLGFDGRNIMNEFKQCLLEIED